VDGTYGLMDAVLRSLDPHLVKNITARPLHDTDRIPQPEKERKISLLDPKKLPQYLQSVRRII